jgi:hypothetical protein
MTMVAVGTYVMSLTVQGFKILVGETLDLGSWSVGKRPFHTVTDDDPT